MSAVTPICPPWCCVTEHQIGERGGTVVVHEAREGLVKLSQSGDPWGFPFGEIRLGMVSLFEEVPGPRAIREIADSVSRLATWLEECTHFPRD